MKYHLPKERRHVDVLKREGKRKETLKEFQKKEDIWIYSTERKKEIIFASQGHL